MQFTKTTSFFQVRFENFQLWEDFAKEDFSAFMILREINMVFGYCKNFAKIGKCSQIFEIIYEILN